MKRSTYNFWRDVALIVLVGGIVDGAFWVLLHTRYSKDFPEVVQDWAPVFVYVVTVWYLIADRADPAKYPPEEATDTLAPSDEHQRVDN
jgi:hypothetical protein